MQTAHFSATAVNVVHPMTTLSPLSSRHFPQTIHPHLTDQDYSTSTADKCSAGEETAYATQYYTTLHPHSRGSSPVMMHAGEESHKIDSGSNSPHSNSSKGSSSDSESSSGEGECLPTERDVGECIVASLSDSVTGSMVGGEGTVKHWTYEDQFKQLYNLTPERERRDFLDKLFSYMQNKGTPITRIPIMAKQPLDLYKLFKLVVERGGLVEVIKKKAWRNVAKELNLPASITSAAFTMRSQYVKYLYPYECEVAKLSNPQELQVAIESNKRDRRHSDTVEFLSPQLACRSDLEQTLSPGSLGVGSSTQGLQLITSPTVAIPHGSLPPYSGGFIVAGSGGHPIAHQVVQMAHHIPGIPIVVPGTTGATGHVQSGVVWTGKLPSEDKDLQQEDKDDLSTPPAKKLALDIPTGGVTLANSRVPTGIGNYIVTPGGSIVQHPSSPHLIQVAGPGHPQIPIVIPAPIPGRSNGQREILLKQMDNLSTKHSSTASKNSENGRESSTVDVSTANKNYQAAISKNPYSANFLQMGTHPQMAGLMSHARSTRTIVSSELETGQRTLDPIERETHSPRLHRDEATTPPVTKMPFANISIQSAGNKSITEGAETTEDSSLLVTMEINNVVFQGVLFAKPKMNTNTASRSPSSK